VDPQAKELQFASYIVTYPARSGGKPPDALFAKPEDAVVDQSL